MTTYNVILFRLDQESGMFVRNPLDRTGERPQIVDILCIRGDCIEQGQRLAATALVGQVEDIFQLRVMAEHPLVEVLGEGRACRFEQRNSAFDDGNGGLI